MGKAQKRCPRCRVKMYTAGVVRAGPRGGKRRSYLCKECGYRRIGNTAP